MRRDEHKAEAERLIAVARTTEGKKALGKYGDPTDPVAVTVLAGVHAQLALVPDDVIDAEVVDEEAEQLAAQARDMASTVFGDASILLRSLANALEARAGTGSGVQITADAFDATGPSPIVDVDREAMLDLQRRLMEAEPGRYAAALDGALLTLRSWLA